MYNDFDRGDSTVSGVKWWCWYWLPTCAGLKYDSRVTGDGILALLSVKRFRNTRLSIRTTTLLCRNLLLDGSALATNCRCIVAGLVLMANESGCGGTALHSSGNIPRIYRSIKGAASRISTTKLLTIPILTFRVGSQFIERGGYFRVV